MHILDIAIATPTWKKCVAIYIATFLVWQHTLYFMVCIATNLHCLAYSYNVFIAVEIQKVHATVAILLFVQLLHNLIEYTLI